MTSTEEIRTWIAGLASDGKDAPPTGLRAELDGDGLLRVVLDRPPGNRISGGMLTALGDLGRALAAPGPVRAVLLTHAGPDFCQGADLGSVDMANLLASGREGRLELARAGAALIRDLATAPVPVVVGIEGKAIGAGAGLSMAAHFRVAAEDSTLCFPEVDRGMHLSWGLVALTAHELGPSRGRRLSLAGESTSIPELEADYARIVPPGQARESAERLARELAAKPPLAVRAIQEVDNRARRRALELAHDDAEVFADTVASLDFAEAMAAYFEKRPGVFRGH